MKSRKRWLVVAGIVVASIVMLGLVLRFAREYSRGTGAAQGVQTSLESVKSMEQKAEAKYSR